MKKLLAVLVLAVLLVGCKDSSGPSDESISGTYTLRTLNAQNLPFSVVEIGTAYRLEVTAGFVTINSDRTYVESLTFRETEGTETVTETGTTGGTWTRNNSNGITFRDSEGETYSATLTGATITLSGDGFTFVYQK